MKNKKHWITQDWAKGAILGAILCTTLPILISIGNDYLKKKPVFSTILLIVKGIWNFIISALNFNIKVWWLIFGILVIIVIIYLFTVFRQKVIPPIPVDYDNYREDILTINRWKWTWDWKWDKSENDWVISGLTPHCPICDTPLKDVTSIHFGLRFDCPRCKFSAIDSQCDEPNNVEMVIHDNIRRKIRPA